MDNTIKLIEAIGKQWPFLITVFVITVILVKWKTIWKAIGNVRQVKLKGVGTEIELTTAQEEKVRIEINDVQKPMESLESKVEETIHSLFDTYQHLEKGEIAEADKIFTDIQEHTEDEKKNENLIYYNYYKFLSGISTSTDSIIQILQEERLSNHDKYLGNFYLGLCYKTGKLKDQAIESFNKANQYGESEIEKVNVLINIGQIYSQNEEIEIAIKLLFSHFTLLVEKESKIKILKELAELHQQKDDFITQIACLEKAAEISVNDTSILFDMAYAYSRTDYKEASIFHYSNLLYFKPDESAALNNIGVAYKQKNLPITAVGYYKSAVEKSSSLAAGNLAGIFLESGFEAEAKLLIDTFRTKEYVDPMIITVFESLNSETKKEQDKKKKISEIGFKHSVFFRDYADFCLLSTNIDSYQDQNWTDDLGNKIKIEINNNDLIIEWKTKNDVLLDDDIFVISGKINHGCRITFDSPRSVISNILTGLYSSDSNKKDKPYRKIDKYEGLCSLHIDQDYAKILYIKDKEVIIKEIRHIPSK